MKISGIVKNSFIDYPGLVSCVLFVPGCNYSCFFCHNRALIDGSHVILSPRYVMDFLQRRVGMLDGVVITGGEPTLQNDLLQYMEILKGLGYKIKLDTNGSRPDVVESILELGLCDYFAVDYKAPAVDYPAICGPGSDASKVIDTIYLLAGNDVPFEVRTTVIPQLGMDALIQMAKEIPEVPRYVLNRYKVPERYLPEDEFLIMQKPHSTEEIKSLAENITGWQPNIAI